MNWSMTSILLALLPVAGTLIIMGWASSNARHTIGPVEALTRRARKSGLGCKELNGNSEAT